MLLVRSCLFAFLFYLWLMFGVRADIASINQNVAVQGGTLTEIGHTVDRIENKLDREPPPPATKQGGVKQ